MKLSLIFGILFALILVSQVGLASDKDPVFTKKDYQKMIAQGRQFTFSERSLWLPEPLRENLLTILQHSLTDQYSSDSVLELSFRDFYHGHIVCGESENTMDLMHEFERIEKSEFETICASTSLLINMRDATCVPKLKVALQNTEKRFGELLQKIVDQKLCSKLSVIYHTREYNRKEGGMGDGDPARNIRVDLPAMQITHFEDKPIDPLKALDIGFKWPSTSDLPLLNSNGEPPAPKTTAMIAHIGFFC